MSTTNSNGHLSISVLMAVYNKDLPSHFAEALDSLRPFCEKLDCIVVVADGSLTHELELVVNTRINDMPIKLIRLANSRGLGEALNEGLHSSSSHFILRMDSDDISRPERLDVLIEHLSKNPELDVIGSFINEFMDTPIEEGAVRRVPITHQEIQKKMRILCVMNHVSCLIRRDLVIKVGGYQGGKGFAEDWWLWARMLCVGGKFSNVSKVLVDVRVGNGFIERRRGFHLLKHDMRLICMMLNIKFIKWYQAIFILFSKIVQRLSPPLVLQFIYSMMRH
jgi:glycosyltransferase involved in cell wall biosynthesis